MKQTTTKISFFFLAIVFALFSVLVMLPFWLYDTRGSGTLWSRTSEYLAKLGHGLMRELKK